MCKMSRFRDDQHTVLLVMAPHEIPFLKALCTNYSDSGLLRLDGYYHLSVLFLLSYNCTTWKLGKSACLSGSQIRHDRIQPL